MQLNKGESMAWTNGGPEPGNKQQHRCTHTVYTIQCQTHNNTYAISSWANRFLPHYSKACLDTVQDSWQPSSGGWLCRLLSLSISTLLPYHIGVWTPVHGSQQQHSAQLTDRQCRSEDNRSVILAPCQNTSPPISSQLWLVRDVLETIPSCLDEGRENRPSTCSLSEEKQLQAANWHVFVKRLSDLCCLFSPFSKRWHGYLSSHSSCVITKIGDDTEGGLYMWDITTECTHTQAKLDRRLALWIYTAKHARTHGRRITDQSFHGLPSDAHMVLSRTIKNTHKPLHLKSNQWKTL